MNRHPVPTNVIQFLTDASKTFGRHKEEEFSQFMWSLCQDHIESPIEQLFMVAINLVSEVNQVEISFGEAMRADAGGALLLVPQCRIGKYKIDFALRYAFKPDPKTVCIELDGHDFHDRNEIQRRYEKARDRFLTANGYAVLHYTGTEVFRDPIGVALEAFRLATRMGEAAIHPKELYP